MINADVYVISDATGQTAKGLCLAIFNSLNIRYMLHVFNIDHTAYDITRELNIISKKPGPVFVTVADPIIEADIMAKVRSVEVPAISVLRNGMDAVIDYYKIHEAQYHVSAQHNTHSLFYKKRIQAIEYAISSDDGMRPDHLCKAQIVIIGPSRCSKTPVSMYIANQGYKVANIPVFSNMTENILQRIANHRCVIGVFIKPERLAGIRSKRIKKISNDPNIDAEHNFYQQYLGIEAIQSEMDYLFEICRKNKWQIIDVTDISIEETSQKILNIYRESTKNVRSNER